MLRVTTLNEESHNEYPEPDGEILLVIEHNKRHGHLTVLVQEDEEGGEETSEEPERKAVSVESPPIDPADYSVDELRKEMADDDYDWNAAAYRGLLEAEQDGGDRSSAIRSIKEAIERTEE